jgi:hypothetical protein
MENKGCQKDYSLEEAGTPVGAVLKLRVTVPVEVPSWNEVLGLSLKGRLRLKKELKTTVEAALSYDSSAIERVE